MNSKVPTFQEAQELLGLDLWASTFDKDDTDVIDLTAALAAPVKQGDFYRVGDALKFMEDK